MRWAVALSVVMLLGLGGAGAAAYFLWWQPEDDLTLPASRSSSPSPPPDVDRERRSGQREYSVPRTVPRPAPPALPQPPARAQPPARSAPRAPSTPAPAPQAPTPGTACVQIYGRTICQEYQRPRGGGGGDGLSPANPDYYRPNPDYGPGIYR
jgi:hypothetical protein